MTRRIVLSPLASRDLDDIADYTLRRWSEHQAERYLRELGRTIDSLIEGAEHRGDDLGGLRPGLRRLRHRNHYFIFFRIMEDTVGIVRILHQRRDWPTVVAPAEPGRGRP